MVRVVMEILQPHEPGHGELQEQPQARYHTILLQTSLSIFIATFFYSLSSSPFMVIFSATKKGIEVDGWVLSFGSGSKARVEVLGQIHRSSLPKSGCFLLSDARWLSMSNCTISPHSCSAQSSQNDHNPNRSTPNNHPYLHVSTDGGGGVLRNHLLPGFPDGSDVSSSVCDNEATAWIGW